MSKKYVCSGLTYEIEKAVLATGEKRLLVRVPAGLGAIEYTVTDQICALPMTAGSTARIKKIGKELGIQAASMLENTRVVAAAHLLGIKHPHEERTAA